MIINSAACPVSGWYDHYTAACPVVSLIVGRSQDLWAAFAGLSGCKRCVYYIPSWLALSSGAV